MDDHGRLYEIMWLHEKKGRNLRGETQMNAFREAVEDCGLEYLGFDEVWFTWSRGRMKENIMKERFDRCLVNQERIKVFMEFCISYLAAPMSDYSLIMFNTVSSKVGLREQRKRRFMFEAMWAKNLSLPMLL
ncbi:hypothetical protein DITRI_Ditri09bG0076900 [Diplodiscus trichospermus]